MSTALPLHGASWADIETRMRAMAAGDVDWRAGRTGLYIFNAGPEVEAVQKAAYAAFSSENGLGPAAFPSLAQMEREVVAAALQLLNAPAGAAGAMTSGGTDSILMAVKTARDYARASGKDARRANIVMPATAHPAFDKAAMLMDIDVRRIATADFLADPDAMEAACDGATIMIVGSVPCFPFGLIDPIEQLSALALRKGLWLHVDACVGAFLAPFVRMNGATLPHFDFALPGVSSMSGDLHKYGYASKGASTVLFRSTDLHARMAFDAGPWPLGRMLTPTLAGTRPGGAIAAAWAVMQFLGVDGYREKQRAVTEARERIATGAAQLGFRVLGEPQLGILAFTHDSASIGAIYAGLRKRGWFTAALVDPPALHLMLSPKHLEVVDAYLNDLAGALQDDPQTMPASPGYAR